MCKKYSIKDSYIAIIGDIKKSKKLNNRNTVQNVFKKGVC